MYDSHIRKPAVRTGLKYCAASCAFLFNTSALASNVLDINSLLVDETAITISIDGAAGPEHGGGAPVVHTFTNATPSPWELTMGTFQDGEAEITTLTDADGDTFRIFTTGINNDLPPSGSADSDFDADGQLLLDLDALRGEITFAAAAGGPPEGGPEHNGGAPEIFVVDLWSDPPNEAILNTNAYDADTSGFVLNWDIVVADGCPPATGGEGGPEHGGGTCTINLDWQGTVDTGAAVVPVPAAAWLLGSGLIGLVAVGRRNRKV